MSQDLLRDNYEDMDLDPSAMNANGTGADGESVHELYPRIPPPLSAELMSPEAAHCILKLSCVTTKLKLNSYFLGNKFDGQVDMRSYTHHQNNEESGGGGGAAVKGYLRGTSQPSQYFPRELLDPALRGGTRKRSRGTAPSSSSSSSRPGHKQARGAGVDGKESKIFGQLERRERAASASSATGAAEGAAGAGAGGAAGAAGAGSADSDYEQDEPEEYDDDYGVQHVFSDDDGGDDDDDEGEPTY